MDMSIFESGRQIGSLRAEPAGLFWKIDCKITSEPEQIRRIYVIKGWRVEYLGIPDARGDLSARIPLCHLPDGFDSAAVSRNPRAAWLPWRGTISGVMVEDAYFRREDLTLALPPEEALKFPAWAGQMRTETVFGRETAALRLTPDGLLPPIETETGGTTNETLEEMVDDLPDPELPADASAGDGFGGGQEADCPDL